ncbi:MAG: S-methyl-5'-thioinosine phosphorylase [Halofilum sp. (in: g-proteobacteria)]|nr:S-methyl-5'-thioinosine phosphorylase [Halofilum sp. (in: g-proteobacteria)]
METLAIIGGTGLDRLEYLQERAEEPLETPYGPPSAPLVRGRLAGRPLVFLARHGHDHRLAPHEIDYRANLWALQHAGVDAVVAIAAVGGIVEPPGPGGLAIPDQLIDYTHGRAATFFEGPDRGVEHVDFTWPYTPALRRRLLTAAAAAGVEAVDGGCYGATQGPRLETAAEIRRLERDGCTLVGMTGMPEAVLARELGLDYACCAVVANRAAGKGGSEISLDEIGRHLASGMEDVRALITALVRSP